MRQRPQDPELASLYLKKMYINELDFSRPRKKPILATFHKVFSVFTLCYELVKEQRDKQSQIHRTVLHQPRPQTAVS